MSEKKYVIERSGYRFTKEEIMYVNSFDTDKEYEEWLKWYNEQSSTTQTSAIASMDRKLEKYLDYE